MIEIPFIQRQNAFMLRAYENDFSSVKDIISNLENNFYREVNFNEIIYKSTPLNYNIPSIRKINSDRKSNVLIPYIHKNKFNSF